MIFSFPPFRFLIFLVLASLSVVMMSCGRKEKDSIGETCEEQEITADLTDEALSYADSLLATMSLEERIGQCFMPAIYSSSDSLTLRQLQRYISDFHVGGVVLLKGDLESVAIISQLASRARVPLFLAIDAEWGLGMRLKDAPAFPRNGRISGNADEELMFEYGSEVARECRRIGVNMVLGPVIDVVENPEGIIGNRSFGSDRERVALLGTAYARGVESGRVISVAKHFPGHGSPAGDSHKEMQVISRSLHALDSVDLYPFRRYIESGLSGVMVGHLAVPAIDPDMLPAAVSPVVITDLLRGELEFHGLVLTDALNMGGAEGYGSDAAIMAGADIVVAPNKTQEEISRLLYLARKDRNVLQILNDRCRRILFYKYLVSSESSGVSLRGLHEDVEGCSGAIRQRLSE